jgi:hypothetical protein
VGEPGSAAAWAEAHRATAAHGLVHEDMHAPRVTHIGVVV